MPGTAFLKDYVSFSADVDALLAILVIAPIANPYDGWDVLMSALFSDYMPPPDSSNSDTKP